MRNTPETSEGATPRVLPTHAARSAQRRGEHLDRNEELRAARTAHAEAADNITEQELVRLKEVERCYLDLLAEAAYEEAKRYDPDLKYPLVRLAEDYFLGWSGICDAPATYRMTLAEVTERGWPEHRITGAKGLDEDGVLWNRAGPGEACLTVAALMEAWESAEALDAFRLTPEKVQPVTTSDVRQNEAGEWEHGEVYWTPWAPDSVPATLPDGWRARY